MNLFVLAMLLAPNPYPLDKELGGTCGSCGKDDCFMLEIKCKVTKREDGKYLYSYRLKNRSKKKGMRVSWAVLDLATYNGHGLPMWWKLKPQQEVEVTLIHKEAPVWHTGPASIQMKGRGSSKSWKEHFEEAGVKLPPGAFYYCNQFGQPGPLPLSFTKK